MFSRNAFFLLIMLALATNLHAEVKPDFNLFTDNSFSVGETPRIRLSSRNLKEVDFRIYKIDEPLAFFQSQNDPHQIQNPDPAVTGKTVQEAVEKTSSAGASWFRRIARQMFSTETRKKILDMMPFLRSEEKPAPTVHTEHDPYAPLNQKNLVESWTEKIEAQQAEDEWYWDYKDIELKMKDPGVYLIEGISKTSNRRAYTMAILSDIGFITKSTDKQVMVWAVNRMSGLPMANTDVTFVEKQKVLHKMQAGADGLAVYEKPDLPDSLRQSQTIVMAQSGPHFAISDPYFYSSDYSANAVYVYTDRPIYRPGQTVYFKGIFRQRDGSVYEVPKSQDIQIEIRDANYSDILKTTLKTNDMGTFTGEFKLGDEPPLGHYELMAVINGNYYYSQFRVDEYKKPEYKVTVTADQGSYIHGDVVTAKVQADYYYGEPVRNADVEYYVFRTQYWLPWWYWYDDVYSWYFEEDEGYEWDYSREMVDSGSGKLNPDGSFSFSYTTMTGEVDYHYILQARVVDASRREITGSKRVVVARGSYFIRTLTDKWVYKPNEDINFTFKTFDFAKQPVDGALSVTVEREKFEDGQTFLPVGTFTVNTSGGQAVYPFKIGEAGYYRVTVTGSDTRGHTISDERWVYVSSEFSSFSWGGDGLQIVPDKNQYLVGETAHVMIIAPAENAQLLVNAECDDIYFTKSLTMKGNAVVVDIPVTAAMQPNFYVSANVMANGQYYSENKAIISPPSQQFLTVEIASDKEQYEPGQEATFSIITKDKTGKGVSAEVSVGVVDEAIYDLETDRTPDIQKFFYGKRWNSVSTYSSLYFSFYGYSARVIKDQKQNTAVGALKGKKDFVDARVRKDFKDTAYWGPTVKTDGSGKGTVTFKMPDNLTTWRTTARAVTADTKVGSVINTVISRKDLIVRLETPRFITQDDQVSIATIVHNYLDDAKTCRVSFEAEGVVYSGKYEIPKQSAGVGQAQVVSDHELDITIPPNGEAAIEWRVTADKVGNARFLAKALTDTESDAMELTIQVLPHGMEEQISQSGELKDADELAQFTVNLPATAIAGTQQLTVSVSPSIAAAALSGMDYLIGYPYGCVEQTMSQFLPTIVVSNALKELNMPQPAWTNDIPKMVSQGLNRLYNYQHDDGGWGWWENDETNAFNTAYVMYGFYVAEKAGFDVDDWRYDNGVGCLEQLLRNLEQPSETHYGTYGVRTTRAYLAYVYSLVQTDKAKVYDAYFNKANIEQAAFVKEAQNVIERMDYVTALNTLTLSNLGLPNEAKALANQLIAKATAQADFVSWGDATGWDWYDNEIETTALALQALVNIDPAHPAVAKAIRFLNMKRRGDRWRSTRDTAYIIYAFTDYLKKTKEMSPNYDLEILANGNRLKQIKVTTDQLLNAADDIVLTDLKPGENVIQIKKKGKGTLYYSSRLSYFNSGATTAAVDNGLQVKRSYYLLQEQPGKEITYIKRPFTGNAAFGDKIFVKVEITSPANYEYVMVEDPLPAGCEVFKDDNFLNIQGEDRATSDGDEWGWSWWYADRDVRDEKVTFFITHLDKGTSEVTYILRAEKPGEFKAMPTRAELMYFPEVNGHGVEQGFNVFDVGGK